VCVCVWCVCVCVVLSLKLIIKFGDYVNIMVAFQTKHFAPSSLPAKYSPVISNK